MRAVGAILGAAALTSIGAFGATPSAQAQTFGFEVNGTYSFLSNGEWAKNNEIFHDEPVVRDTWHISSTCTTWIACTGQITSDQGWTAPLKFLADHWVATRDIPDWAPCEAGGAATGHQMFWFYGVDENGQNSRSTDLMAGKDMTHTDSGSCGRNKGLFVDVPMRLERIS